MPSGPEDDSRWTLGVTIQTNDPKFFEKWEERFEQELSRNLDEAREWILTNCGRRQYLDAVMHLHGEMYFQDWLVLLGDLWCGCEKVGLWRDDLVEIIKEWVDEPLTVIPKLMSPEELKAFEDLPEQITIYRGCGSINKNGLSWTFDRQKAMKFPFYRGYRADQPILLTAIISKRRAAALKLERNEQEIIVIDLPESCWKEEPISEPPSME